MAIREKSSRSENTRLALQQIQENARKGGPKAAFGGSFAGRMGRNTFDIGGRSGPKGGAPTGDTLASFIDNLNKQRQERVFVTTKKKRQGRAATILSGASGTTDEANIGLQGLGG